MACPTSSAAAHLAVPSPIHRMESVGARIELLDLDLQLGFLEAWNPGGAPRPAIDETALSRRE